MPSLRQYPVPTQENPGGAASGRVSTVVVVVVSAALASGTAARRSARSIVVAVACVCVCFICLEWVVNQRRFIPSTSASGSKPWTPTKVAASLQRMAMVPRWYHTTPLMRKSEPPAMDTVYQWFQSLEASCGSSSLSLQSDTNTEYGESSSPSSSSS